MARGKDPFDVLLQWLWLKEEKKKTGKQKWGMSACLHLRQGSLFLFCPPDLSVFLAIWLQTSDLVRLLKHYTALIAGWLAESLLSPLKKKNYIGCLSFCPPKNALGSEDSLPHCRGLLRLSYFMSLTSWNSCLLLSQNKRKVFRGNAFLLLSMSCILVWHWKEINYTHLSISVSAGNSVEKKKKLPLCAAGKYITFRNLRMHSPLFKVLLLTILSVQR